MTSGYPPQPEPFAEALGEAAQTAAMAYRLMMTITDAVRRATQKRLTGKEEKLSEDAEKMAPGWSADQLRGVLGDDILAELMAGADWPQLARQLVSLQQAGIDLGTFLPQMGSMTAGVHQAVVANIARTKAEGTDRWADLLKATMPEGLVRDAIHSSPAWPDIASAMARLDAKGIDVARILTDAHAAGVSVDQAIAAVTTAAAAPAAAAPPASAPAPAPAEVPAARTDEVPDPWAAATPAPAPALEVGLSRDARRYWGPLTEGLDVPKDLNLGDRNKAMHQLGVRPPEHARIVSLAKDVLGERDAGLLVGSRPWPLLAARIQRTGESDGAGAVGEHLARLAEDDSWRQGPPSGFARRLVMAHPPGTHHTPGCCERRPAYPPAAGRTARPALVPPGPLAGHGPVRIAPEVLPKGSY
ncbi:hypothetical protein ABZX75_30640 [Streptomyces sp. NPDC003038]|uniref:hypothetical protein n=1 Tax=unclassified Streptomyces TaxID=2593676 RepID=UPI00339EABA0